MSKHDQTRINFYQFVDNLQNMGRTGRDQQGGPDGDRSGAERAGDQQGGPDRDQSPKQARQKGSAHKKPSGVLQGRRTKRHRADCLGTSRVVPMGTEARTARNDQSESRGTDTRSVRIGNHVLVQIPKQVR